MPSDTPLWLRRGAQGWLLELHVQPGARTTEIMGEHGGRLKLKIAAPPVDNKANAQVLDWLSRQLGLPRSALTLIRGGASRLKTVQIDGGDLSQLIQQLDNKSRTQ